MDSSQMIEKLNDLIQLDYDAIGAYGAAIDRIEVESIRAQLRGFQGDHQRHVTDLSQAVQRLGGQPKTRPHATGFVLKGFTAITSMMGTEAALRAMQGNENLTNRGYSEALKLNWTSHLRSLLEGNLRDEQRHLAYIEDALRNRIWEHGAAHP